MPRTTDAPTDADLDRLIDGARAAWGRAGDHYPAGLDGFSYAAAVREADEAHRTIGELAGALVALRAELAEARPVVAAARALDAAWLDERAHEAEHRALTAAIDAIDWTTFRLGPPGRRPAARDGGEEERG